MQYFQSILKPKNMQMEIRNIKQGLSKKLHGKSKQAKSIC